MNRDSRFSAGAVAALLAATLTLLPRMTTAKRRAHFTLQDQVGQLPLGGTTDRAPGMVLPRMTTAKRRAHFTLQDQVGRLPFGGTTDRAPGMVLPRMTTAKRRAHFTPQDQVGHLPFGGITDRLLPSPALRATSRRGSGGTPWPARRSTCRTIPRRTGATGSAT